MKVLLITTLILFLAYPASAELTKQDLEEIQKIVKAEVRESEDRLNARIDTVNNEMGRIWTLLVTLLSVFVIGCITVILFVIKHTSDAVQKVYEYGREMQKVNEGIIKESYL